MATGLTKTALTRLLAEKLELTTVDIAADKQTELLRLFPEVRTEGGKIDFDRLRLALGETEDAGDSRIQLDHPRVPNHVRT